MQKSKNLLTIVLIIIIASLMPIPQINLIATAQETNLEQAQTLLAQLSAEEKIGQLFYITLPGNTIEEIEASWNQINHLPLGGIYLTVQNNNYTNAPDALDQIFNLNTNLQLAAYNSSLNADTNQSYIPLFLGTSFSQQEAAYFATLDQSLQFPSQMGVAATWDQELASQYGQALGKAITSLGFNLYDGFSLDMLVDPTPLNQDMIGTDSLGGNPQWVSQMSNLIVSGIKTGSQNQLLVVSNHFPEISHSDRNPALEIPTISRTLSEMQDVELLPYRTIVNQSSPLDGVVVSPIRYQGLQGDALSTTKPILFDQQALSSFLSNDILSQWHQTNALVISSPLNTQSIRHYNDPQRTTFNASGVARDALIAGNDLLKFEVSNTIENALSYTEFLTIYDFFIQKYMEDVAFAERVDQAVTRILQKKYQLYSEFRIENVIKEEFVGIEADNNALFFRINRNALTLISPTNQELENLIPSSPNTAEKILIFTEMDYVNPCISCDAIPRVSTSALEDTILSLYGSEGAEAVFASYVNSYSFSYLETLLSEDNTDSELDILFNSSDWILFLLSDKEDQTPDALIQLLSKRPDLVERKNSIAFSMGTPNSLDTTAISKLTAYYTLYSETNNIMEIVARVLFKEITPTGASPISVASTGYKIEQATAPDEDRIIPFSITPIYTEAQSATATQIAQEPSLLEYRVGDSLMMEMGPIVDQNGNPVPDGTPIQIEISYQQEGAQIALQLDTQTTQGYAAVRYVLENSGTFQAQVVNLINQASSAPQSFYVLGLNEESPRITPLATNTLVPTQTPTFTPTPTTTPTLTPTSTPTATPTFTPIPIVTDENGEIIVPPASVRNQTNLADWLIMLLLSAFFAFGVYNLWALTGNVRWAIRSSIFIFLLNSFGNAYLSLGLPGASRIIQTMRVWGFILVLFLLTLLGLGITFYRYKTRKTKK